MKIPHWISGHRWEKFDSYTTITRGYRHAIIKDYCVVDGCTKVKTVVGGPLLLWPSTSVEDADASDLHQIAQYQAARP